MITTVLITLACIVAYIAVGLLYHYLHLKVVYRLDRSIGLMDRASARQGAVIWPLLLVLRPLEHIWCCLCDFTTYVERRVEKNNNGDR